jgi:hypothetical protein
MTPQQISSDIERGLDLRATIKTAQAELKSIEKRLEQAGLEGDQIPLQEADREGRQFLARSPKLGLIVPVVFESDQIIASYRQGSEFDGKMQDYCVENEIFLIQFFVPETTYSRLAKDGQNFRKSAREILGSKAPGFVAQCLQRDKAGIPKSRTIIAWENLKQIDHVTA